VYAVSGFALSVVAFHSLRAGDLYQDRALSCGIIFGFILSGALSIIGKHFLPFKNFMPAIITFAQVASAIWHGYYRNVTPYQREEQKPKLERVET